ncbi:hypothetical protein BABINDRAFT_160086 [Babjeviella inositovora NRRL Y-12698]|uniref:RING-type E3 ubiquitin transferase n=1 Tax=Babjeviella inositovora NRRL Y-12698 TaxID=984486 RepID=A0A1E3QW12_9ASCO|nr:uncharacterized protein BABINDRAFT_160086 [Babjeviella inositovora NRRL Y-12698]ODQ81855.1 hypothetical protein BABINDRAFT_160086 [Babjeviella inositovora NRRL Y-12698]
MSSNPARRRAPRKEKSDKVHTNGWRRNETTGTETEALDESEQCLICAERIEIAAYSPCNHVTCHKCTFRQRALYGKKTCLVCRTENATLVFSEDGTKSYDAFSAGDFVDHSEKFGISFTSHYARDATLGLLDFACVKCGEKFANFKKLNAHVKEAHQLEYCHLCGTQKKAFLSELRLYTRHQLQKHLSAGDESGFTGHPACKFCSGMRFYSDDEWNDHMKKSHERCHICDKLDPQKPQYFKNYDAVWRHFEDQHFTCGVSTCREAKFVVFQDEFELQLHMSKEHPSLIGNSFTLGGARGFRSGLSTFQPNASNSSSSSRAPSRSSNRGPEEVVDSFETKQMRLEERARHYLNYATRDFETFTRTNAAYKSGDVSLKQLLKTYNELFTTEQSDIALLLKELAELYPASSPKRSALLDAMNDLQKHIQQEEQFPAFPGSDESLLSDTASWRNKSSKKSASLLAFPPLPASPSSRPAAPPARPVVGKGSAQKFPPLAGGTQPKSIFAPTPTPPIRYTTVIKKGSGYIKPQVNTSQASASYKPSYLTAKPKSASPSPSPTPILSVDGLNLGVSSKKTVLDDPKFPSLPVSTKKPIPRVNPISIDPSNWGKKVPAPAPAPVPAEENKGKKKKGKKQILFQIGI